MAGLGAARRAHVEPGTNDSEADSLGTVHTALCEVPRAHSSFTPESGVKPAYHIREVPRDSRCRANHRGGQ